jgi:hypothetical protein
MAAWDIRIAAAATADLLANFLSLRLSMGLLFFAKVDPIVWTTKRRN